MKRRLLLWLLYLHDLALVRLGGWKRDINPQTKTQWWRKTVGDVDYFRPLREAAQIESDLLRNPRRLP